MQKLYLKKISEYFYNKIYTILISLIGLCFVTISYFLLQNKFNELKNISKSNLYVIEKAIDSEIAHAEHLIYSMAATLLHDLNSHDLKRVQEILQIFDPQLKQSNFPCFSGFKVLDKNNKLIAHSLMPLTFISYSVETDPIYLKYIENIKKTPFELYIDNVRVSRGRKIDILPMGMSIVDANKNYIGVIISGLLIEKLNKKLNSLFSYFKDIKLLNPKNYPSEMNGQTLETNFTLKNIISFYMDSKPITFYHRLHDYPIMIEAKINFEVFSHELVKVGLVCLEYIVALTILIFVILKQQYKFHYQIISIIKSKLKSLNIKEYNINNQIYINPGDFPNKSFLINLINNITENYKILCLQYEEDTKQHSQIEMKEKISNLLLSEKYKYCFEHHNHNDHNMLCSNLLNDFLNEEPESEYLSNYLEEIIGYCSEYYNELKIYIASIDCDRSFSFKKIALNETIFHIFTFIIRTGQFDIDNNKIVITGRYENEHNFPTITIKTYINDNDGIKPLGWESGVDYTHASLFTIYLLAKKNNLFFHAEQTKDKICFVLKAIEETKINELLQKTLPVSNQ